VLGSSRLIYSHDLKDAAVGWFLRASRHLAAKRLLLRLPTSADCMSVCSGSVCFTYLRAGMLIHASQLEQRAKPRTYAFRV
jgi:hypothetical protein